MNKYYLNLLIDATLSVLIHTVATSCSKLRIRYFFLTFTILPDLLFIRIKLSFLSGTMDKYNLSNGVQTETIKLEKGEYANLSRIDFSVGLRFNR